MEFDSEFMCYQKGGSNKSRKLGSHSEAVWFTYIASMDISVFLVEHRMCASFVTSVGGKQVLGVCLVSYNIAMQFQHLLSYPLAAQF